MPSPVYLITGFLDSGKTTLIKETLEDSSFMENVERTLIIQFEEGEEEFEPKWCLDHSVFVESLDDVSVLTTEKMKELDTLYHPSQVFIEWNGSVALSTDLFNNVPEYWPLVEILSTVDATTFPNYITNMRSILFEQLRYSDVVIVNRCLPDTNGSMLRGNIKAINQRCQIFYEGEHGQPANLKNGVLPFSMDDDPIVIKDEDYGIWYMDCCDNPGKYNQKHIVVRGFYAENIKGMKQSFILGRRAMVCCEQDTSLCSFTVTGVRINEMKLGSWYEVEGTLKELEMDNGQSTVVLYASRVQEIQALENPYVVFS